MAGTTSAVLQDINVQVIDATFPLSLPDLSLPLILGTTPGLAELKNTYQLYNSIDDVPYDEDTIEYTLALRVQAASPHVRQFAIFNITRFDYKKATVTSGVVGDDNSLVYTARRYGPWGENVTISLLDPSAPSEETTVSTNETKTLGTGNAALDYTSKLGLDAIVRIGYVDPNESDATLSLTLTETEDTFDLPIKTITVNLATNGGGAITSTALLIKAAILADSTASTWVTPALSEGSDGSGVVVAAAVAPIKFNVVVSLGTDAQSAIDATATVVKNAINASTTAALRLTAANNGASDGTGIVEATSTAGVSPVNEEQVVTLTGMPTGGTFTLTYAGQTTGAIAYNASAATVDTALEALGNIGAGDVTVTGDAAGPWTIEFTGALAGTNVVEMTADGSSLTGTGNEGVEVETTVQGVVEVVAGAAPLALDRDNTADSAVELSRALGEVWDIILKDEALPQPYFLLASTHDNTDVDDHEELVGDRAELSDAVASRVMFYITSNNNNESSEQIHDLAIQMISDRTRILAHTNADSEWAEAVLAGLWGAHAPGSFTTRYKRLNTIEPSRYTTSQIAILRGVAPGAPGVDTYANAFGSPVTTGSWSTDGSFSDWRRDKDWLELHVTANIFFLLRNKPKVLGDARGIAEIRGAVKEVLDRAANMGIIAKDEEGKALYEMFFPTVREWPVLDKARRVLTQCKAVIHPGGAIEGIDLPIYADFTFFAATS